MASKSPLIELGWLPIRDAGRPLQKAVEDARALVLERLEAWFPRFDWRMPAVPQPDTAATNVDEPAARLYEGVQARDSHHWDFALVVTGRDLQSYYKSHALAVPSRARAVGVISLARLAPFDDVRAEVMTRRIAELALHVFGDLNGLRHRDAPDAVMQAPEGVGDLDRERIFDPQEIETLEAALAEVADQRLEETATRPANPVRFYLRASRERAGEVASAVMQARPWEFPLRLSRLTAAAFSALFVLLVTAEVWDLGTSQHPATAAGLSLAVLGGTTAFILARQKLILRRAHGRVSEQTVVMHVSAALVVLLGMLTTYATLFALTLSVGSALFAPELVARWAPAIERPGALEPLLVLAGLVSSLGLLIGSLGASFEGNHYFRHVIYADEEI